MAAVGRSHDSRCPIDDGAEKIAIAAFHNAYRDLAARYQVTLVPFILMNVIGNPQLMQRDRAHPNAEGARMIADSIWPYLKTLIMAKD